MTFQINEPTGSISKKAISVWRINHFFKHSMTLIVLCILLYVSNRFSWYDWINITLYVMLAFVFLMALYDFFIHPVYLQRTWRYGIDEHVIQLKFGFLHRHHIVIPLSRVEYVNTHQGPLLRRYHLSAITIGTITSQHDIPALDEKEAHKLRHKIIALARINKHDEDHSEEEVNERAYNQDEGVEKD